MFLIALVALVEEFVGFKQASILAIKLPSHYTKCPCMFRIMTPILGDHFKSR